MNDDNKRAAMMAQNVDLLIARAEALGERVSFHDRSGTYQVRGHRIDRWFDLKDRPQPYCPVRVEQRSRVPSDRPCYH